VAAVDESISEPVFPWSEAARHRALLDFWTVYDANYDAIQRETVRVAESHPCSGRSCGR